MYNNACRIVKFFLIDLTTFTNFQGKIFLKYAEGVALNEVHSVSESQQRLKTFFC